VAPVLVTTLVKALLKLLELKKLNVKLCAPTGRADKCLSQTTGMEATTIHRLLEINSLGRGFKYNEDNRLICDYLIVDESSMIDVTLFYALIRALYILKRLLNIYEKQIKILKKI